MSGGVGWWWLLGEQVSPSSPVCFDPQADLRLPRGVGEKKLLREVATSLGCHVGAAAPKRAIQFGSRVAKVTGSAGEQGSDICSRLTQ